MTPLLVLRPSQYTNFGWYITALGGFFVHPTVGGFMTLLAIYKWLDVSCWSYEFYEDQICEKRGIFNVTREYIQISRIKSVMIEEPLFQRFIDVSTVNVITSEQFKPSLQLYAIPGGDVIKGWLDEVTHVQRNKRGIKEFDMFRTN